MKNFNSKNPCHIGVIGTAFSKVSPNPPPAPPRKKIKLLLTNSVVFNLFHIFIN